MTRVLIISTTNIYGGVGNKLFELCRRIDRSKVSFDFMHYRPASDVELKIIKEDLGGEFFLMPRWSRHPLRFWSEIRAFYRKHRYDCVHIRASTAMYFIMTLPLWNNRDTFIICQSHQGAITGFFNKVFHNVFRRIIVRRANVFMAVSQIAAQHMFGTDIAGTGRYIMLRNGVDTKRFAFDSTARYELRQSLGLEGKFVIGNVGRFHIQKNHSFILDVFEAVLHRDPDAVLLLVGNGELEAQVRFDASEREIDGSVIFYGTTDNVPSVMQVMDVFFLPSLWEGLPNTVIEAQAAGLPVVASRNITGEVAITPLYHSLDLQLDSADAWADLLLGFKDFRRTDTSRDVARAGFDVADAAKVLEGVYLR